MVETKVVKIGPARPVQHEKSGTGLGTDPVEPEKQGRAKNLDKTGHPPVELVTRLTRCRVNRFLLLFSSFNDAAPFLKKLHRFLTFYFIDFLILLIRIIQFVCLLRLSILLAPKVIFKNLCVILFCYMYLFILS